MHIKKLPEADRPREKMLRNGVEHLSDVELLAVMLGTGTKEKPVFRLATEILSMEESGILFLSGCSAEELAGIKGVGPAKACKILAGIEIGRRIATKPRGNKVTATSPDAIVSLFMEDMRYYKKEVFKILLMNAKGEIIGTDKISMGDLTGAMIHPREVFLPAIKKSAAAVAFVHNHPSGDPQPSGTDIETTKKLVSAGEIIGISVWDHIIIGDGKYVSFREERLI